MDDFEREHLDLGRVDRGAPLAYVNELLAICNLLLRLGSWQELDLEEEGDDEPVANSSELIIGRRL